MLQKNKGNRQMHFQCFIHGGASPETRDAALARILRIGLQLALKHSRKILEIERYCADPAKVARKKKQSLFNLQCNTARYWKEKKNFESVLEAKYFPGNILLCVRPASSVFYTNKLNSMFYIIFGVET